MRKPEDILTISTLSIRRDQIGSVDLPEKTAVAVDGVNGRRRAYLKFATEEIAAAEHARFVAEWKGD